MKKSFHIIILILLSFKHYTYAQTDSSYLITEEILENILQEPGEEEDHSSLYDNIEQFILNPVDLNRAEITELLQIPGMNYNSAKLISAHRNKYGYFFSINELNAVQGLDRDIIDKINPFITVGKQEVIVSSEQVDENIMNILFTKTSFSFRSRVSNDLQTRIGFADNKYAGTKPKVYNRLLIKYKDRYQFGFLTEKDPGETKINDFESYHFSIKNLGILQNLILGDYLVEFGKGLVMWNPYSISKGTNINYTFKTQNRVGRPYTGSTETNYLHGALVSIRIDKFILTSFYSQNNIDADIDSATGDIISRSIDGLHRTQNELKKQDTAKEKLWGARIDFEFKANFRLGMMYSLSSYSNDFQSSGVFDLKGRKFNYYSTYYDLFIDNIKLFGEFGYNGSSVASINSLRLSVSKNLTFITSVRSYPRNYVSLYGNAFGEKSGATTNEFGIYTGLKWKTSVGIINFYYDQFKFPFATFSNQMPTSGDEFLSNLFSKPLQNLETLIRYKYEKKEISAVIENNEQIVKRLKQQIRFEIIYYALKQLRLKGRFEYSDYKIPEISKRENGYLVYQDIRFTPNFNLNIYARIIFFNTDSFNSAIYEYENDLTGVLTNRPLFGNGIRWYLIFRYRPVSNFTVSLKYSETYKPDEETISSGMNEINGNLDNNISFQIDYRY